MKARIKNIVKAGVNALVKAGHRSKAGHYINTEFVNSVMGQVTDVSYYGLGLKFSTPNRLCHWRANTFVSKEPETL